MKKCAFITLIFCSIALSAQNIGNMGRLPVVETPKPPFPYQYQQNRQPANPYNPNEASDIQRRNQAIIDECIAAEMNAEIQRQAAIKQLLEKGFPSQLDAKGFSHFFGAFREIRDMLEGRRPLNLARTVFLVENAYYGNQLDYQEYNDFINHKIQLCELKIAEEKHDIRNNMVKNMMLFRLISDTLTFKQVGAERTVAHLPVKYDYDDYQSKQNFDSHFVTKLMRSNVGQCYSMPLYFLILAEAMEAEAYWSFSPRHSFVKIQDEKGRWFNLELTNNSILSDAHYMNNSYIKAEAIRNKLYLEPLNKTNIVAEMLLKLASYFYTKYGLDNFYLLCAETAEKHLDNSLNADMLKAAYQTRLTLALADLLQAQNPEALREKSPEAYRHYEKMHELYKKIDESGYEELPDELYARWLEYIARQKEQSNKNRSLILNEIR